MNKNLYFYLKLLWDNIPFAITPFIGMIYFMVTIPITSSLSSIESAAYSLYATTSTLIIFSFAAIPPSMMKFTRDGVPIKKLFFVTLTWSITLSIFVLLVLFIVANLYNNTALERAFTYFLLLTPDVVFSILCGFWSSVLIINKRGNELFKVGLYMLALKFTLFYLVLNYTDSVLHLVVIPSLIVTVFYYAIVYGKAKDTLNVIENISNDFSPIKFIKSVHTDSLDAIVISTTFMFVVWISGTISESAIIFSTIIMTTMRLVVLPMKRFGLAYGSHLSKMNNEETKFFIVNTIKAKYIALIFFIPLIYSAFLFTNSSLNGNNINIIFFIILSQVIIEPIASYLTSISKYLGLGYKNLKYTIIYQWFFCIPIILIIQVSNYLTLESLWGVMVFGRWIFAIFYIFKLHNTLKYSNDSLEKIA